jgi:putative ABC transport system permease protein
MRPAWRLAISSLCGRPSRSILLTAAIALSAALVVAVTSAVASVNASIRARLDATLGTAHVRVQSAGLDATIPQSVVEIARHWPGVRSAVPSLRDPLAVSVRRRVFEDRGDGTYALVDRRFAATSMGHGVDAEREAMVRPVRVIEGRLPAAPGEIAVDEAMARWLGWTGWGARPATGLLAPGGLGAFLAQPDSEPIRLGSSRDEAETWNRGQQLRLGDDVEIQRLLRPSRRARVVGIVAQPPLGGRFQCYLSLPGLQEVAGRRGQVNQVDLVLDERVDPARFAQEHAHDLGEAILVQTTERMTSGLDRNLRSGELGGVLVAMLATMTAGFIVLTGLGTAVTERERELGILRAIGASRRLVAGTQVLIGLVLGLAGAAVGVPLGVALALGLARGLRDLVPAGLQVSASGMTLGGASAVLAGVLGSLHAAHLAAGSAPLSALAARARAPTRRRIGLVLALGLAGVGAQALIVGVPDDGQVIFWLYATTGLPAMFTGYFLLGTPAVLISTLLVGAALGAILRLPRRLVPGSIRATPFRFGFTAGALMAGLALMVDVWTVGGGVLRDWLGKLDFPDAFVNGVGLTEAAQDILEALPFVERTCAVTLVPIETDAFGVRALQRYSSTFIAFEPDRFFAMTRLAWVQGSEREAIRRLEEGGAIIVAREFSTARGLGVGDTFRCAYAGQDLEFEIVGVVASPGLEVVSRFFNVGDDFTTQSVHAVFGSRADLRRLFHTDTVNLIQIDLADGADDEQAMARIREAMFPYGILDAGSGRQIKREITTFVRGSLVGVSVIAVFAMFVASLGVANVVAASVHARQFEFGVLRAVGAPSSLLVRQVLGEVALVGVAACGLGTLMGLQAAWAVTRLYRFLLGLTIEPTPPIAAIAAGCGAVLALSLLAAAPHAWRLARRSPRDLLAAARG